MLENRDLYEILGISVTASPDQIKAAFRSLAQKHHPDLCKDNSPDNVELFVSIKQAYETLIDPEKRNEYNKNRGFDHYEEVKIAGSGFSNIAEQTELEEHQKVELSSSERLSAATIFNSISSEENIYGFRIGQKAKMQLENTDPNELEQSQLEEVAAWGEEPIVDKNTLSKKTGIFNFGAKVGSIISRTSSAQTKRLNLKNTLKSRMSEEPDRAQFVKVKKPQNPNLQNNKSENNTSAFSAPRGERIYEYRISKLEAIVGTTRKLAIQGRDGEPIMRDVNIPAGVSTGQILEVSWGWERARIKVIINFEPLWDVRGLDLYLRLPITIDEAIDKTELIVPCFAGQTRAKLNHNAESVVIEGKGLFDKAKPGKLIVTPCIVPPQQSNPMLDSACAALESSYVEDVRSNLTELIQDSAWFWSEEQAEYLQLPITFSEALNGASINISIDDTDSLNIIIPKFCNPEKIINIEFGQRTLCVLPVVVLPRILDANCLAAARAIAQFYNSPVRKNLPKKFSA